MSIIRLGPFFGANTALRPKLLPNNVGVLSENHWPDRGDLRPWNNPLTVGTCASGTKTIFMLGRDVTSDAIVWFQWTAVVHAIRSFRPNDTTKRTYYSGIGAPKVTDNILGIAGAPYPTSYRDLGIPKPTSIPILTETTPGTGTDETRFYAYTFLSDWDEEGPPQVSAAVTCKPGALFDITNMAAPPSGVGETRGINRIRIYRTVSGEAGAAFYFLRDITVATSSTDDGQAVGSLILPSTMYAMPPTDLTSLTALWNGMMAGISGNAVRYCETFKPHAWPVAYETLCVDTPVALAVFQKNLLILTTGRPRLVYGTSPEAMDDTPVEFIAGCVSVQSAVSFGHGAVWATSKGLAYVGTNGSPRLLTEGVIQAEDWLAMNPATMVATQYKDRYFCFYDSGAGIKGFVINPLAPAEGLYHFSTGYTAAFFDPLGEQMYVVDGLNIKQWNAGSTKMVAKHRSKVYREQRPISMGWAEVIADTYPAQFTLYADNRAPWTRSVTNSDPFTLPSGYLAENHQIQIETSGDVTGVVMAETLDEIAQG